MPTTTKLRQSSCPVCRTGYNVADAVGATRQMRPGDPTICGGCGAVLVLTDAMGVRLAETTDFDRYSPALRKQIDEVVAAFHQSRRIFES